MKLITRDAGYAIRALCLIAKRRNEVLSVEKISRCLKIPKPLLRKSMQFLNKKRLLFSYKGIGGGFKMALSPNMVSILKIIEIFQGPLRLTEHKLRKKACPEIKSCPLKKRLDVLERRLKSELRSITIDSLLRGEKKERGHDDK